MINFDQVFLSPAKINLFLHIIGQREDGYHELQTVFQFIDLYDELGFSLREHDKQINRLSRHEYSDEIDLTMRAASLLQAHAKAQCGVDIHINKNIPAGGGLGGGSSNAATSLLVLNELWSCGLSKQELAVLGLQLGADVPIFIHGHAAWAEGVGEEIQAVNPPEPWFLLVSPNIHVSTAQVFSNSALTRNTHAIKIRPLDEAAGWQACHNDCESVVRQEFPLIDDILNSLSKSANAKLTGTGACIFAAYENKAKAEEAQLSLQSQFKKLHTYLVKGMNQSPLHQQLGLK